MRYDFETIRSRKGTGSVKWNMMYEASPSLSDDIVPLSVADMEFLHAPEISEAVSEFVRTQVLGYAAGHDGYLRSVVDWMQKRNGWKIEPEWIVEYPGVVPALNNAVRAFTSHGDSVLVMTPVYYPFYDAIKRGGCKIVESELVLRGDRYEIDFEDFEKKASGGSVRLLILCSPHNPVGRVWTRAELERIAKICEENDIIIVSDEIHKDLIMPGYEHTVLASINDLAANRTVTCTAPSKTFNLAGLWTSSIIISNPELREKLVNIRELQGIHFCNTLGRAALEAAYTKCDRWHSKLIEVLDGNRALIKEFFEKNMPEVGVIRLEGTYLQWLDFRAWGMTAKELEEFMTKDAQVFGDEGYIFGEAGAGFERLSLAVPRAVLEAALSRILRARNNRR